MKEAHEAITTIALYQVYDQVHLEQLMDALKLYPTYDSGTWDIQKINKIEESLSQVVEKNFQQTFVV